MPPRTSNTLIVPLASLMDHAEPVPPHPLPVMEPFTFADVPRLTTALKSGDEAAYAWLHAQWRRRISRYSFALAAGDESFAGEIAQATWLRIVRHMRPLNDEAVLWNWVACAARHAATDLRRKGGRYHRALSRFAEWWSLPRASEHDGQADSLVAALEAALLQLNDAERRLIDRRYFSDDSLESIGTPLSLSARAVEGRLARARQRLRELIAAQLRRSTL